MEGAGSELEQMGALSSLGSPSPTIPAVGRPGMGSEENHWEKSPSPQHPPLSHMSPP